MSNSLSTPKHSTPAAPSPVPAGKDMQNAGAKGSVQSTTAFRSVLDELQDAKRNQKKKANTQSTGTAEPGQSTAAFRSVLDELQDAKRNRKKKTK
ncbi:MAG: hypothetical protein MR021_06520 [Clostridiales bacterium]|nr:hypothetical protein [Clostridiales bacterium]